MTWASGGIVRVGKHLYAVCPDCRGLIKITGWFRGAHVCTRKP